MLELYPSNNLTILQKAEYHCTVSVDVSENVSLLWKVNGDMTNFTETGTYPIENSSSCIGNITFQTGIDTTLIISH